MKRFFYDLETTGVKVHRNGIHQISGVIDIDGVPKETFDFKVRPNPKATIEVEALEVGGVTMEQIQSYPTMDEVYREMLQMLGKYVDKYNKKDKFFLIGYNNRSFDDQFFRAWFKQNHDEYFGSWFWSSGIDVMVLAANHLAEVRPDMENFKLMTVCRQFGMEIDEDKLHDAFYDVKLTRDLFYKMNEKL